jgi:hypothetical protein
VRWLLVRWPAWGLPLVVLLFVGLGTNAAVVPESPGRWQADPARAVAAESEWATHYLVLAPRVGDRISTGWFVALVEGENQWATVYLLRQRAAVDRAAARLPAGDIAARAEARAVDRLLDHDLGLLAAAMGRPLDPLHLAAGDPIGAALLRQAAPTRSPPARGTPGPPG